MEAEWVELTRGFKLKVFNTTKANIGTIWSQGKVTLYQKEATIKYKGYIQQAMNNLQALGIYQDERPRSNDQQLKFSLHLVSQEVGENISWLEERWEKKRENKKEESGSWQNKIKTIISVAGLEEREGKQYIKYRLKFEGELKDMTGETLRKMKEVVRELSQEPETSIVGVSEGCVVVEFSSSLAGFRRLERLVENEDLEEIEGFPLLRLELGLDLLNLGEWFSDLFSFGWEPAASSRFVENEEVLGLERVSAKKEISLGRETVVLLLRQEVLGEEREIRLLLFPGVDSVYLPHGIKLLVVDEVGEVIPDLEVEARGDNWLQLSFDAEVGDKFGVRVSLEEESFFGGFCCLKPQMNGNNF